MLGVAREGRDGRAGPGQRDGQGTRILRGTDGLGQLGAQAQGGRLQVIDEAVAQLLGFPAQGGGLLGRGIGQGGRTRRVETVELAEHFGGGQALVGQEHDPVVAPLLVPLAQDAHVVSAPGSQGDAAGQARGDVGAQRAADRLQLLIAQAQLPQFVASNKGGGRVGRSAGHAAGDGDALIDANAQARGGGRPGAGSGEALKDTRGAHSQVGLRIEVRHRAGRGLVDAPVGQVRDRLDAHAGRLRGAHDDGFA